MSVHKQEQSMMDYWWRYQDLKEQMSEIEEPVRSAGMDREMDDCWIELELYRLHNSIKSLAAAENILRRLACLNK